MLLWKYCRLQIPIVFKARKEVQLSYILYVNAQLRTFGFYNWCIALPMLFTNDAKEQEELLT